MSGAGLSHVSESLPPVSWSRTDTGSSLAPIFRLPYELLIEILLIGRDNSERIERFLLVITSTCSVWRSAALITPSLWAVIRRPNFKKIEYEVEYLETVLERSKDSLLDIELKRYPGFPAKIVKTIYPHLARCRRLCLPLAGTTPEIFPLPGPLERLTTLSTSATLILLYLTLRSHRHRASEISLSRDSPPVCEICSVAA